MWDFSLIYLIFQISVVFGQNLTDLKDRPEGNQFLSADRLNTELSDLTEALNELKVTEFGSFLDEMTDWASSANEYVNEKSTIETSVHSPDQGRKLKYKRAELKFIMKTLIILKVILGLTLPLGIIASKILSWKAVTLSLMALMLAKIMFVKNLLTGKNAVSLTPTNFVPPVFVHGGPNEFFWKRHGDAQNVYPWNST